jgi:hypothetical protein
MLRKPKVLGSHKTVPSFVPHLGHTWYELVASKELPKAPLFPRRCYEIADCRTLW